MPAATARHTRPGGLFVLEMSHPADFLTTGSHTKAEWEMHRDDLTVHVRWGASTDPFDPITQVQQTSVRIEARRAGQLPQAHEAVVAERRWTATEVGAVVCLSDEWEVVARHGDLSPDQPFDNSAASWRMVHVLCRRAPQPAR
jgi:hypothetical protein